MAADTVRTWVTGGVRLAAAAIISLLIWEVLLRAAIYGPITNREDPTFGLLPAPNSQAVWSEEGFAVARFNELGFRDGPNTPKAPGELRILCVGDSNTEARQVDVQQTFVRRLQAQLNDALSATGSKYTSVRVINAGRNGTTVPYHIGLAEAYRKLWDPDWVVVTMGETAWGDANDPRTNEFYFKPKGDTFEIVRHSMPRSGGRVRAVAKRLGITETALAQFGWMRVTEIKNAMRAKAFEGTPKVGELKRKRRESITQPLVHWAIGALKRGYPKLVVVQLPFGSTPRNGLADPGPSEKLVVEACMEQSVPVLAMREIIQRDFAMTGQPTSGFANTLPWSGHPNAHGHELIASELAAFFNTHVLNGNPKEWRTPLP